MTRRSMDGIQTGIWSKQIVLHLEAQLKDLLSNAFAIFFKSNSVYFSHFRCFQAIHFGMFYSSQMQLHVHVELICELITALASWYCIDILHTFRFRVCSKHLTLNQLLLVLKYILKFSSVDNFSLRYVQR